MNSKTIIVQYLRVDLEKPREEWAVDKDGKMLYGEFLKLKPDEQMRIRFVGFENE